MIRLAIADDHPVVREGLKRLISECYDIQVVAEAVDSKDTISLIRQHDIDVLLLDISMPGGKFLDTMKRLKDEKPGIRILVLSVHPEETYALRAFKSGASGYMTKDNTPEELTQAIRHIFNGGKHIPASVAERIIDNYASNSTVTHENLSDREYEVLCMLGSGKRLKDIASELALSPKTISTHRSRILEKLNLNTTAELIRYAMENRLE